MITSLIGYTDKYDEAIKNDIDNWREEETIDYLNENDPNPTLAEVLGVIIGMAYGFSLEDLLTVLDEDNFDESLKKAFDSILKFVDDTGVTWFDKRD